MQQQPRLWQSSFVFLLEMLQQLNYTYRYPCNRLLFHLWLELGDTLYMLIGRICLYSTPIPIVSHVASFSFLRHVFVFSFLASSSAPYCLPTHRNPDCWDSLQHDSQTFSQLTSSNDSNHVRVANFEE